MLSGLILEGVKGAAAPGNIVRGLYDFQYAAASEARLFNHDFELSHKTLLNEFEFSIKNAIQG